MQMNIIELSAALLTKLDGHDIELSPAFKQQFVKDIQNCIKQLTHVYNLELEMIEKLPIHISFVNLFKKLKCALIRKHINDMSQNYLENTLSEAIMSSFKLSAPNTLEAHAEINKYIENRIPFLRNFLLKELELPIYNLEDIMDKLRDLISKQVLNEVRIYCGYDVYSIFSQQLTLFLNSFIPYIDVETPIENIEALTLKFAPKAYRYSSPLSGEYIRNDPCSFIHYINYKLFEVATNYFKNNMTKLLPPPTVIEKSVKHKEYLREISNTISALDAYDIIRKNHVELASMKKLIGVHAHAHAYGFYRSWMRANHLEQYIGLIQDFKGGFIPKRIYLSLIDCISEAILNCYDLPNFLRLNNGDVLPAPSSSSAKRKLLV